MEGGGGSEDLAEPYTLSDMHVCTPTWKPRGAQCVTAMGRLHRGEACGGGAVGGGQRAAQVGGQGDGAPLDACPEHTHVFGRETWT